MLLFAATAQAQTAYPDLIVTLKGDTIRCAFGAMRDSTIVYYRQDTTGKPVKESVKKLTLNTYQRDFYARKEAGPGMKPARQPTHYYRHHPGNNPAVFNGYFGLDLGVSTLTTPIPQSMKNYWILRVGPRIGNTYQRQTSGQFMALYGGVMLNQYLGIGVRSEWFGTSYRYDSGKSMENSANFFVGLEATGRLPFRKNGYSHFYATAAAGPIWGQNDVQGNGVAYTQYWGKGFSVRLGAGARVKLARMLYATAGVSALSGYTHSHEIGKVSLNWAGASAGLMLAF
jgi:hypothetical protein